MNLCPVCQRCFDDTETICSIAGHGALVAHRPGSRVIAGKYRLDRLLGRGGVGAVYLGTHIELDSVVAVKLLLPALVDDPQALERFRREARAAARLAHPALAATYDFGPLPEGGAYIAMEYVEGPTLRELLDRGPLPIATAISFARGILEGIDVAHRAGIVHRDLKPSNVIMATDHEGSPRPTIVDFGLAKLAETTARGADAVTLTGTLVGTPRYMSPEQCAGRDLDARSDLYSLGVILYEMLAAEPPFDAPTATALALRHINDIAPDVRTRRPETPVGLAGLVTRLLAKDPADRPQTAAEVGFELAQIDGVGGGRTAPIAAAAVPTAGARVDDSPPTLVAPQAREESRGHDDSRHAHGGARRDDSAQLDGGPLGTAGPGSREGRTGRRRRRASSALPLTLIALVVAAFAFYWLFVRESDSGVAELREVPVDSIVAEPMDRSDPIPSERAPDRATPSPRNNAPVTPTNPAFDRGQASRELRASITDWIASTNDRDVDAHLDAYASRVDRFYLERNVPRSRVREIKRRLFEEAEEVRMSVGDARVSYSDGGRTATTRFRKEYAIRQRNGTTSRGAVLQELVWRRTGDGWRIVSERDARILE